LSADCAVTIAKQKFASAEPNESPLRYRLDRLIRNLAMRVISALAPDNAAPDADPRGRRLAQRRRI